MNSPIKEQQYSWSVSSAQILRLQRTGILGLKESDIRTRQKEFGLNNLTQTRSINGLEIFIRQFKSPLIFTLIAAAVVTVFLQEWIDTVVILLAIIVNTSLGFYQEYRAEQSLQKLQSYIKDRVRIIRNGVEGEYDALELVPGDIIVVSYGMRIAADARLITVNGLKLDEAILTGESLPVSKTTDILPQETILADRTNMIYAGTLVAEGYGTAVVVATGVRTEIGRIAALVGHTKRVPTPLQRALIRFGWSIFGVALCIVALIFGLGIFRGEHILEMLKLSAAVAVGAIPEALPIALTVILAVGVERLARRNGVMRNLAGAETLGSTTLIMTDKTGTLTEAKMRLVGLATRSELVNEKDIQTVGAVLTKPQKELLSLAVSNIDVIEEHIPGKDVQFLGKPLEANIAYSAYQAGIHLSDIKKELLIPFSSVHKFSVARNFNQKTLVVLGAPDILLGLSQMNIGDKQRIEHIIETLSNQGNRLIGLARLQDYGVQKPIDVAQIKDIEFVGLIILRDPIRADVPEAVQRIESHGVKVVMITGDLPGTARAVAQELGWRVATEQIISGAELREMSDEVLLKRMEVIKIFVRVTPEDKLRVAILYKKMGHIVAMTGDGVNDAPSLKAVDIGIAIGSGSDVAKATAGLVLLDDNFKTIVAAIDEGRRIVANIRKVFVYLMSNSLDEIILIGGCLLVGLPLPLTALQIIWVNFFTGSLPALAFAFDDNYDGLKVGKKAVQSIFSREVIILTAGIGVMTSILLFILYAVLLAIAIPVSEARMILFMCFATYILVVSFSFRSLHKPIFSYPVFANRFLNISIIIALVLVSMTALVPYMRSLFELSPISHAAWFIVPVWLFFNIILVESAKWAFRRMH